jgi:hypothetical protein
MKEARFNTLNWTLDRPAVRCYTSCAYILINNIVFMKNSKLDGKLRPMFVVLLASSTVLNYYVQDRDLRWVFLVSEALFLGFLIGVSVYDWILRKSK